MALYPGGSGGGPGGGQQRRPPPYPPIRDSWIHEIDNSEVKITFFCICIYFENWA